MSTSPKYRKAPDGEWLSYPELKIEYIPHESFQFTKYIAQSLVDNRKGRVHVLMEHGFYQRFLRAVRKKFGGINSSNVHNAVLEALKAWIEGVEQT